ncbi:MAG: STAS domain-containing protein [Frankiaceae bacterium]
MDSSVDYVQIRGDVDQTEFPELDVAAQQLIAADASTIYVDLGGVTFMGSTMVTFLVRISNAKGFTRRPLVLCRPTPMARKVLQMTGLDQHASTRPDLPPLWPRRTSPPLQRSTDAN